MLIEDLAAVIGSDGFEKVGVVAGAAPDQSSDIAGQLEGGKQVVGLTDSRLDGVAAIPHLVDSGGVLRACQYAGLLAQLDAGALAQAEGGGILTEGVDA